MYYFFWQYLNDVEELENWINDKMALATSKDYGKDENSADKLLTKNKVGTIEWREIYVYRYWYRCVNIEAALLKQSNPARYLTVLASSNPNYGRL